jgi:exopolyphosphatase/pppGpp-phosphohydrolase
LDKIFSEIYNDALIRIFPRLSKELTYHNADHARDVLDQAIRIAHEEGISNKEDLLLLKIAALYHDTGFIKSYSGHEEVSCDLAREELPVFGINDRQLDHICKLIMVTKMPRYPENKLEEIICDADLDYLGRTDFFKISNLLFLELKHRGLVHNEYNWNKKQVHFLKVHQYFTPANRAARQQLKLKHLSMIEQMLQSSSS